MKKNIQFFLLLLALLLPVTATAHDFEVDGVYYNINGTEATVTFKGTHYDQYYEYSGDVIIPVTVTYGGTTYFVTSIGDWAFSDCIFLTSVTIPNSVTSIGGFAFYSCMGLTQINIPNSVTTIEGCAFYGCTGLTSIDIPNSVKYIGVLAFSDCYNLLSVTIGNSVNYIGGGAFGCQGWFGDYIFGDYCSLTNIVVADGNSTYDSRNSCNAIIETASNTLVVGGINTTIPNTVTSIGSYAFEGCCPREMYIPNSVVSIGDYAFYNCNGPNRITIPNSVTYIGNEAFGHNEYFNWGWDPEVYSYIIEPSQVTFGDDVFQWWEFSPPLHVPYGSTQAYQADSRWSDYFGYIVEMELVPIESIQLNVTTAGLNEGATLQLSAMVQPEEGTSKKMNWASSNPSIATVDNNGLVTTHGVGTATITAMTTDGSNLSATCVVTLLPVGFKGDVNDDGRINISDVSDLIDILLNGN